MPDSARTRQELTGCLGTRYGKSYVEHDDGSGDQIEKAFNALGSWRPRISNTALTRRTPHWLWHSFASPMIAKGEDAITVAEADRWKSMRLVVETCGHLAPGRANKAIDNLPFGTTVPTSGAEKKKT
jgi:hypothetical protein